MLEGARHWFVAAKAEGGGETGFGVGSGEVIAVGGGGEVGVGGRGGDIGAGAGGRSGLVLVLFMASVVVSSGGECLTLPLLSIRHFGL